MNGISLKDFPEFNSRFRLVTVRYREDSKEMRFTYANDIAAKALELGAKEYPDGAVFAKIGFVSERDPSFVSSVVPSGAKRYQFMVRGKKKFAETDGWGYALFNGNGQTFNGEPKANSLACASCHRLVPERNYVFSQFASFTPFVEKARVSGPVAPQEIKKLKFETRKRGQLSLRLARLLPSHTQQVRWLTGDLQKNIFDGTVGEIGPFLARESASAKIPAVLASDDGRIFAFAYAENQDKSCGEKKIKTVVGRSIGSNKNEDATEETVVKLVSYCFVP